MMHRSEPIVIAPECYAPGCHHDGDQYTMVKCRTCGHWFCAEHLETDGDGRSVTLVDTGLTGLAYYVGQCAECREKPPVRHPVDSSWLR